MRPSSSDPVSIASALERLAAPSGTIVVLLPESAAGGLFGVFGGAKIDRGTRCAVLLARGCHDVGAGIDPVSKLDVVWGTIP